MKKYIKPTISVVEVELESLMMQMSSGNELTNSPAFDENNEFQGGSAEARPFDIWDFEE